MRDKNLWFEFFFVKFRAKLQLETNWKPFVSFEKHFSL